MFPVRCRVVRNAPMFLGEGEIEPPVPQPADAEPQAAASAPSHAALEAQANAQGKAAQERMKKIEKDMESALKKEMIKTAASQANITIALAFIPYVGAILSLVASAIFAADAKKYKGLMEKAAKAAENDLKAYASAMEDRLSAAGAVIFEEEMPVVHAELVNLAIGNPVQREGFDGIGFGKKLKKAVKKIKKEIERPVKRAHDAIERDAKRFGREAQASFDVIRGKAGYVELKNRLAQMVTQAKADMNEQEKTAMQIIGTDEHRASIRTQIRIHLTSDPEYTASLAELQAAARQSPAAASTAAARAAARQTGNTGTLMLVGGAALAAFMLMR
jgi:hypothetical protein